LPTWATRLNWALMDEVRRLTWKQALHARLRDAQVPPAGDGPVSMDIAVSTGPGRNWGEPVEAAAGTHSGPV